MKLELNNTMIKRHIEYTKEHKEKIRKSYKDFTKPQYLGEEGDMIAVRALSIERACEKMRQLEMETGDKTREEVEEDLKLEDISTGWLQLVDDDNKNHENITVYGCEDFVSLEETSDYPLFVHLI